MQLGILGRAPFSELRRQHVNARMVGVALDTAALTRVITRFAIGISSIPDT
jgi:hypothetical protein